jgi:serine/threonine-protein kinase
MMNPIALAGLATAALLFAPSGAAGGPGLASFAGSWHAHEEGLGIDANGHGQETYADKSTCPEAPAAGCGKVGTVDFTLISVSGDTATGVISAASNPKQPIGGPVTIKLVGGGRGLQLWMAGGDEGFPFCNSNDNAAARHYYCGA